MDPAAETCPRCQLVRHPSAPRCNCGWDYVSRSHPGEEGARPSVWQRFSCMFLDFLIIGFPFVVIQQLAFPPPQAPPDTLPKLPVAAGVVTLISSIVGLIYFGTMHGRRGRTIGKMTRHLKVVTMSGDPITMPRAYLRAVAFLGPSLFSGPAIILGQTSAYAVIAYCSLGWNLVNLLMALTDRSTQRAWHDNLAGTRVIVWHDRPGESVTASSPASS